MFLAIPCDMSYSRICTSSPMLARCGLLTRPPMLERDLRLPNNQFCKIHHLHTQPSISPARAQGLEGATATLGEMHSAVRSLASLCSADHETRPVRPVLASPNTRGRRSAVFLLLFLGLARQSLGNKKVPLYPPCIMGYHIPTSGGNCTACAQGKFGLGDYT